MGTKERNISIDIMKFLAVLLITNSHMDKLYGNYNIFATGGAIGDVLFFSVQDIHFFLVHWDVLISGIKKGFAEFIHLLLLYLSWEHFSGIFIVIFSISLLMGENGLLVVL